MEQVRDGGSVVCTCLVLAYGVHESGYREVIGLDVGECETEAIWCSFLGSLVKRGLTGVELVVADAHAGLESAIAHVLGSPWQRCSAQFLREALGHERREQRGMLAPPLRASFTAESGEQARALVGDASGAVATTSVGEPARERATPARRPRSRPPSRQAG